MRNLLQDQAEGLRRLLGKPGTRFVRLNSARRGVGKTSCAVNLAVALAQQGREVLIIDENDGQGNVADCIGLPANRGFLDCVRGKAALDEVVARGAGISLLSATSGMNELQGYNREQRAKFTESLEAQELSCDIVIVDTSVGSSSRMLSIPLQDNSEVMVVSNSAASVTDAYAFLKGASAEYGKRRYRVLMSKVRDEPQATAMFNNMAGAARRYLGIELDLMGLLPFDDRIARSAMVGQPLLRTFPDAPAAGIFRRLGLEMVEWPQGANSEKLSGFLQGLARFGAHYVSVADMDSQSTLHAQRNAFPARSRMGSAAFAMA